MVIGCQPLTGGSMRWLKETVSGLSNPHDAAARNRVSKMRKYVQQGGDVNKQNKLGDTPLHEACAYIRDNGESSKIKSKRRKGIMKDGRKFGKRFAQQGEVVVRGDSPIEMLELLIDSGSDINAQNIVGDAPLHKAAINGRALAADFLIQAGANVNIRNEFAQTPLHAACVSGSMEIVQRLVQGGADTSAQDAAEDTPFHEACRHQYENIVIYLMGRVNNPDTSEGLKLWEGLDPTWAKMLRSSAQEEKVKHRLPAQEAADGVNVATVAGSSSATIYLNTPSTVHNSLQSDRGRTPSESKLGGSQKEGVGGGGPTENGDAFGGVRSSQPMSGLQPKGAVANGVPRQPHPIPIPVGVGAKNGIDSRSKKNIGESKSGRQEVLITDIGNSRRSFCTRPSEVLDWQASKAKNVEQGKVIEKAREALCEEQQDDTMDLSSVTLGDDDCLVNGGEKAGEKLNLRVATNVAPYRSLKEGRKSSPTADGRTTPLTCIIRDPTREGVRRKSKSVVVLPSPRARLLRRSPVSEKMSNGARRRESERGDGVERVSRHRPPSVPNVGAKSRSRTGSRSSDAPPGKGHRRSSSSRSRKEGELVVAGDDVDAGSMGKSHHRRNSGRHKERDAATRSPGRRYKVIDDRSRGGGHRSRRDVGESGRGQRSRRDGGDDRGLEESKTALSNGTQEHRTTSASSRVSSDVSKRESKRSMNVDEATSATKVFKKELKMHHNDNVGYKNQVKEDGEVKSEESSTNEGVWMKRLPRRTGSSQELVPPTWASELDARLVKVLPPKKKVVESPLPIRRKSPYRPYRINSPSPCPKGAAGSPSKKKGVFFPIHAVPISSTLSPTSLQKKREDTILEAVPGTSDVSGLQKNQGGVSPKAPSDSSVNVKIECTIDVSSVGNFSDGKGSDEGGKVRVATVETVPRRPKNLGEAVFVSRAETLDEGPPNMEALHTDFPEDIDESYGAVTGGGTAGVEVIVVGEGGIPVKSTSWVKSTDERKLKHTAADHPTTKIVVFSDSETDNDRCSSVRHSSRASNTFGDAGAILSHSHHAPSAVNEPENSTVSTLHHAPSAVDEPENSTVSTLHHAPSAVDEPENSTVSTLHHAPSVEAASCFQSIADTALSDEDVERAMEKSAEGAASSFVFHSSFGFGSGQSVVVGAASTAAALPPAILPNKSLEEAESANGNTSECRESDAESISSSRAWVAGARAAAADAQEEVNEQESHGVVCVTEEESVIQKEGSNVKADLVVASSVAIPDAAAVKGENNEDSQSKLPVEVAARKHSMLGRRRDRPSVKVTMPIVGGRAAWDKFLADAGVNDNDGAAESVFRGDGTENKPASSGVEATAESAEASNDSAEEEDVLNERVPRGFKDPIQVDGPNKGPAGAFSGNAMWRLAGGASGAANRARSGVEVGGDGGFSNPLSVMRAADSRISQAGANSARGGGFPNPLAGVRGAARMTNAGVANPLARGRGAFSGVVANPLGGGGGGGRGAVTGNHLGRRSLGAGTTTQGGNSLEGLTSKGLPASSLGGRRTSAPTAIGSAETSLRISNFSPGYSSDFVSVSAETGGGGGGNDFATDGSVSMGFGGMKAVDSRVNGVRPLVVPRRRARSSIDNEVPHGALRDPGRAKVASVVMAFQKPSNQRNGLVLADPHQVEVSNVAEQGLVQLRRVNWSPHPGQRENGNVA